MQKRRRDKWRTLTRSFDDDAQRRSNLASGCNISLCQNMFYLTHTHTHTHGKISGISNGHWNGTSSSHPSPNSKVPTPSLNQTDNLSFRNKKIQKMQNIPKSWNPQKWKIFQKSRKSQKYCQEFLKNCRKSWKNQSCESISCRLRNSYLQLRNLPSSLNQFRPFVLQTCWVDALAKRIGCHTTPDADQSIWIFVFKMNYWILSDWPNKSEPWNLRGFDVWKYLSVNCCGRYARNVSISPTQSTK